jgi:hypothetical protein
MDLELYRHRAKQGVRRRVIILTIMACPAVIAASSVVGAYFPRLWDGTTGWGEVLKSFGVTATLAYMMSMFWLMNVAAGKVFSSPARWLVLPMVNPKKAYAGDDAVDYAMLFGTAVLLAMAGCLMPIAHTANNFGCVAGIGVGAGLSWAAYQRAKRRPVVN